MWQRQSSPQQRGEVWGHGMHGSAGAHLGREVRSGAVGHVAALEPPRQGGEVQGCGTRGSAWRHALLLVFT
jgi:hypothetical protein